VKRFSFSLDKVLELRSYAEKDAEIALAKANGELSALEQRMAELARERVAVAADRFSPGRSVPEIRNAELYLLRLERDAASLTEASAKAALAVEAAQEAFIEARKDREVIDKLKTRRSKEYRKSVLKEETAALDDISSGRYARKAEAF